MDPEDPKQLKLRLEQSEFLLDIFRSWFKLREKSWPSECSGKDVEGYSLDILDADVAGIVSSFIHRGNLSKRDFELLLLCDDTLPIVIREIDGFPFWWFSQLKRLTGLLVEYDRRWQIPTDLSSR